MKRRRFHPRVYADIVKRQDGLCACGCEESLGTDPTQIHFDHVIPLWKGGEDEPSNLQALKPKHHLFKTCKEATDRAKFKRLHDRYVLKKPKLSQRDRILARMLEEE